MTWLDPTLQYTFLMGITLLFTVLAINRRSITLSILSAISWFASSLAHQMISPQTSPLTNPISLLYMGIGIIFTIATVMMALNYLKEERTSVELK